MGVTIYKAGEYPHEGESHEARQFRLRRERAERMRAHAAREQAFREGKALDQPYEDKALDAPPAAKTDDAQQPTREELEGESKAALIERARDRGIEVTRADGRDDLEPTVSDYIRALTV